MNCRLHIRGPVSAGALAALGVAAAAAALLLTLGVVACAGTQATDSGLQGQVRIGPINPVEQPGVPNDRPYAATLNIKRESDGKVVAQTKSGVDGSFRVALPPGEYILEPVNGDPLPVAQPQTVAVAPGQFTTVRVDYDSGIR